MSHVELISVVNTYLAVIEFSIAKCASAIAIWDDDSSSCLENPIGITFTF